MSRTRPKALEEHNLMAKCPYCEAAPDEWCRTMTTGRWSRLLHEQRYWAAWRQNIEASNP